MRFVVSAILAFVSLSFAPAPTLKPPMNGRDLKNLQGKWILNCEYHSGNKMTPSPCQAVICNAQFTLATNGVINGEWILMLNEESSPKEMDLIPTDPLYRETRRVRAIYRLTSDTLEICYPTLPDVRPTEFRTFRSPYTTIHFRHR